MENKFLSLGILIFLLLNVSFVLSEVSEEDAFSSIEQAKREIKIMEENGFSTDYVSDELREAENLMSQLEYVEVLNDPQSTPFEKNIASKELRLINYRSLSYEDVLIHTENIISAKEEAFTVSDEIRVLELKIEDFEKEGYNITEVKKSLFEVYEAFNFERYGEARELIIETEDILEKIASGQSRVNLLIKSSKNFFQLYGFFLIIISGVLLILILYIKEKVKIRNLRKKLRKLNNELKSLDGLLRKTQEERFKKASISGLVYNIRSENYKSRIEKVRSEIAVVKKRIEIVRGVSTQKKKKVVKTKPTKKK